MQNSLCFNHVKQELVNLYDAMNLLYQLTKIAKIDPKIAKLSYMSLIV